MKEAIQMFNNGLMTVRGGYPAHVARRTLSPGLGVSGAGGCCAVGPRSPLGPCPFQL